jgi:hypothetical protein
MICPGQTLLQETEHTQTQIMIHTSHGDAYNGEDTLVACTAPSCGYETHLR